MTTIRQILGDRWVDRLLLERTVVTVNPVGTPPGKLPASIGKIAMRVVEVEGETARATGGEHLKPYLASAHGRLPMKPEEVILGASGLPCNATIVEPVATYDVEFTGETPARMHDGVLVLRGAHDSVKLRQLRVDE